MRRLICLALWSIPLVGCSSPHEPPREAVEPLSPSRYCLSAGEAERFAGSPGWMRIIEVRDAKTNRLWVVLQSTGSANPPRLGAGGEGLSESLVVLSTSTEGKVK